MNHSNMSIKVRGGAIPLAAKWARPFHRNVMMVAMHSNIWFLPRLRRLFPAGGAEYSNHLICHPIRLFPAECSNDLIFHPIRLSLAPTLRSARLTFNTSLTSYISNLIQTQTPIGRNTIRRRVMLNSIPLSIRECSENTRECSSDRERVFSAKFNTNIN